MNAARRDPEATRLAILDAAEEVFLDRGVADATTSEIARLAGVTKSLIHHHFGAKKDLWKEVKLRRFAEYGDGQRRMLQESGADEVLLRDSMALYFRFLQRNPEMVRLLAWMFLEDDEECADLDGDLMRLGVERIRETQEAGAFRQDLDPRYILIAFLTMTQHWFQFRGGFLRDVGFEGKREALDEEYLESMLKIFFEGIGPKAKK
jgi:TetR/AcrR family transcriptional regulator